MPPHLRQLSVTVAEARGLLAGDINGLSDPFVELSARDARGARLPLAGSFSTPVVQRTLSPEWNARFSLGTASASSGGGGGGGGFDLRLATSLRFLVYDYDALKFNDVLGEVDVPLAVVEQALAACDARGGARELDAWYQVRKVPGAMSADASGELRLVFSAAAAGEEEQAASAAAPPPAPVDGAGEPANVLFVTVEAARGLLAMDKDTRSSDPLVKLALRGQRRETRVVRESLKPHWDETFSFLLPPASAQQLELLVEDEDRGALRNDFLGRALVPVPAGRPADEQLLTVPLLDRKLRADRERGALRLRLQRVFDPRARQTVAAMARKRGSSRSAAGGGSGRPGVLVALQHSMRARLAPDQEDDDTDEEDGGRSGSDSDADDRDGRGALVAAKDDWLMAPYDGREAEGEAEGEGEADGARRLAFAVVTVHAVEALPSMDAVALLDSGCYASASAWGATCSAGGVGGAVDAYVTAGLAAAADTLAPARTRVKSVFGPREQLRARFRDRLMVFLGDADADADAGGSRPSKAALALTVMDWDPVGEDELVGRVELPDAAALAGRAPFWVNLYGAPTGSGSARARAAADRMNLQPTLGSAFRGRVCLSVALATKRAAAFEPKHQTCRIPRPLAAHRRRGSAGHAAGANAVRLPWPESGVFKLRAHFVRAEGVPAVASLPAVALVAACGLAEVGSSARRAAGGAVEWNDVVESDRFALPTDAAQMPDVFLYLCYASDATPGRAGAAASAKSRKQVEPLCFRRLPAKALLASAAAANPRWLALSADRAADRVRGREAFPGAALVRLELLPWSDADAHPARREQEDGQPVERWSGDVQRLVNARAPFQLRVRVDGLRNLVLDDAGGASDAAAQVVVQCGGQEDAVQLAAGGAKGGAPRVVCLDLQLPPALAVAPRVLLHVRCGGRYVGSAALPLDGRAGVAACARDELGKAALPPAQWLSISVDGLEDAAVGQVGASALLVRKSFPDEVLPPPADD